MKLGFKHIWPVLLLVGCGPKITSSKVWQGQRKAAICLTYDDGMQSHLDVAIPQLDRLGLRGTFYLNTVKERDNILGWKAAARAGHELGNHSLFHPCPNSFGWPKELTTENYTVADILKEIEAVNHLLKNLDPNRKRFSYAYPCNNTEVGSKSYIVPLKKSGLIQYARGGGKTPIVTTDFDNLNRMHVYSWAVPEGTTATALIAFAQKAKQDGGLAVFQFHGVDGEWIKVSGEAHEKLLEFLSDNASEYWVAPFSEIMDHLYR